MSNIYTPPQSELSTNSSELPTGFGSLEKGVNGDFEFVISEILSEAWDLTKGHKLPLLGAGLIYMVVAVGASLLSQMILMGPSLQPTEGEVPGFGSFILGFGVQTVLNILVYPLIAGVFLYAATVAARRPVSFGIFFSCYPKTLPIFGLTVLSTLLMTIGMLLLLIPGIYLSVAYIFALPLLVEKDLGIWEALESSRKALTHCWFRFFGFLIVLWLVTMVGMIPMGIGLIWTGPFAIIAFGVAYRQIFGFEMARA